MDGPAFSTRAESNANRESGFDVIGMTNLPEAKLAREAEIALATLAMVTDYDCWKTGEEAVTAETVFGHLQANNEAAKSILAGVIPKIPKEPDWPEHRSLDGAIHDFPALVAGGEGEGVGTDTRAFQSGKMKFGKLGNGSWETLTQIQRRSESYRTDSPQNVAHYTFPKFSLADYAFPGICRNLEWRPFLIPSVEKRGSWCREVKTTRDKERNAADNATTFTHAPSYSSPHEPVRAHCWTQHAQHFVGELFG